MYSSALIRMVTTMYRSSDSTLAVIESASVEYVDDCHFFTCV